MRKTVAPVPKCLEDTEIVMVDVGARNGITELRGLAQFTSAFGFEPSPEEYSKLEAGVTDLDVAMPGYRPRYRAEKYFPYALTAHSGKVPLYITRSVSASSTLRPNASLLRRFRRHDWGRKLEVVRTESVPCHTLHEFMEDARLSRIDYLKLDTQGNEFDILNDSRVLPRIGIVKTEVEFVELYEGQKLYADIARLMHEHGFVQFDLRFEAIHYRGLSPEVLPGGLLTWADAYFIQELAPDRQSARNRVAIMLELGNDDYAFHLARESGCCSDEELAVLHAWFVHRRNTDLGFARRLKRRIERLLGVRVARAQS